MRSPYSVPNTKFVVSYLTPDKTAASPTPTNVLQIVVTLGPGVPSWTDSKTATLREFGLYGKLDNGNVLVNYVIHAALPKDPASTLERTLWLDF